MPKVALIFVRRFDLRRTFQTSSGNRCGNLDWRHHHFFGATTIQACSHVTTTRMTNWLMSYWQQVKSQRHGMAYAYRRTV